MAVKSYGKSYQYVRLLKEIKRHDDPSACEHSSLKIDVTYMSARLYGIEIILQLATSPPLGSEEQNRVCSGRIIDIGIIFSRIRWAS